MASKKPEVKKELLGVVGVDSGQLVIMDPCYIDNELLQPGNEFSVQFWGQGEEDIQENLGFVSPLKCKDKNEAEEIAYQIEEEAKRIGKTVLTNIRDGSFYDKCCEKTLREEQGGQLYYEMGHPGLGIVSSSGWGDGAYEVYAHKKDFGKYGERVVKLEVVLIDDKDTEDDNLLEDIK